MKPMKKLLCVLLACLMLVSVFGACGKKGDTPVNTDGPTRDPSDSSNGGTDKKPADTLATEDFGDSRGNPRDFIMMVRASRYRYLYATAEDSDTVAKAAYDRNTKIEDDFNVMFDIVEVPDTAQNWNTLLSGASGEYDLCCFDYLYRVEEMGLLHNMLNFSAEIDLTDSWWYKGWNDVGTVNGQLYSVAGDAANEMIENMSVIFYNKRMASDHGLELYSVVDNGGWTLAKMQEISKSVSFGMDDDDVSNNIYGAMFDLNSIRMANACFGLQLVKKTENGFYELVEDATINTRNWNAIQSFQSYVRDSKTVQYDGATCRSRETATFTESKSLFFATALLIGERMKTVIQDWKYGMLPYPKYQENDKYIGTVYGCSIFGIPQTVRNPHCSAVILNALNFYSKDTTVAAFYDKTIAGKVTDTPDDYRMVEMVRSNIVVDFAFIHDENVMTLFQRYAWAVTNGDSPSVIFGEHKITAETGLRRILDAYSKESN